MRPVTWRAAMHGGAVALAIAALGCGKSPSGPSTSTGEFDIEVRYIGTATPSQQRAVDDAIARWRTVIQGDLPAIRVDAAAGQCFDGQPAIDETIDDLLIYVQFAILDGPGGAVAQAGPCFIRNASSLPVMGVLTLDTEDIANVARAGVLGDVALHELGHVIGIGTLWTPLTLLSGAGTDDPQFTGPRAGAAYNVLSGVGNTVPVENVGGVGTRDGHWRESIFGNELMTGTLSPGGNPLSAMTIESLDDMGYTVNLAAASAYSLPQMAVHADASAAATQFELRELLIRPVPID